MLLPKRPIKLTGRRVFRTVMCSVTLGLFLFNTLAVEAAWALAGTPELAPYSIEDASLYRAFDPASFSLPDFMGTVEERHVQEGAERVLVHIQDAHCNAACQKRIAEIIEYLRTKYGMNVVNLEGGAGGYDLTPFTDIPEPDIRRSVAEYFVEQGLLNGAELFAVTDPDRVRLWGIEDPELYFRNLKAYRRILPHRSTIDAHLLTLSRALELLKERIYSERHLELDRAYRKYRDGESGLQDYLNFLVRASKRNGIDIRALSNLYLLTQAQGMEDEIDFRMADVERAELIDRLRERLSMSDLQELTGKIVDFRSERVSKTGFYGYLVEKAAERRIELSDFPELRKYIVYVSVYEAADDRQIMHELDTLEDKLREAFSPGRTERELSRLSKELDILTGLFGAALTKEEYRYLSGNDLSVRAFSSFIEEQSRAHGIDLALASELHDLDRYRDKMSRFYEYSLERDEAFLANMRTGSHARGEREMPLRGAIMVTGGFHTENLAKLFRERGISFVSVMPRFRSPSGQENPYFRLLTGEEDPVESGLARGLALNLAISSSLNWLGFAEGTEASRMIFLTRIRWKSAIARGDRGIVIQHGDSRVLMDRQGNVTRDFKGSDDGFEVVYLTELAPSLQLASPDMERPHGASQGNLIGKLFHDPQGNIPATSGVIAYEDGNTLVFEDIYNPGVPLYDSTGSPARVALTGEKEISDQQMGILRRKGLDVRDRQGRPVKVKLLDGNSPISGYGSATGGVYLSERLADEPIALYHELAEAYYSRGENASRLPAGVNAHTYLRGCGKDIRNAFDRIDGAENMDAETLIQALKNKLGDKARLNEAGFALIRHNATGKRASGRQITGRELLYGRQDKVFSPEENEAFSFKVRSGGKSPADLQEELDGLEKQVEIMDRLQGQEMNSESMESWFRSIQVEPQSRETVFREVFQGITEDEIESIVDIEPGSDIRFTHRGQVFIIERFLGGELVIKRRERDARTRKPVVRTLHTLYQVDDFWALCGPDEVLASAYRTLGGVEDRLSGEMVVIPAVYSPEYDDDGRLTGVSKWARQKIENDFHVKGLLGRADDGSVFPLMVRLRKAEGHGRTFFIEQDSTLLISPDGKEKKRFFGVLGAEDAEARRVIAEGGRLERGVAVEFKGVGSPGISQICLELGPEVTQHKPFKRVIERLKELDSDFLSEVTVNNKKYIASGRKSGKKDEPGEMEVTLYERYRADWMKRVGAGMFPGLRYQAGVIDDSVGCVKFSGEKDVLDNLQPYLLKENAQLNVISVNVTRLDRLYGMATRIRLGGIERMSALDQAFPSERKGNTAKAHALRRGLYPVIKDSMDVFFHNQGVNTNAFLSGGYQYRFPKLKEGKDICKYGRDADLAETKIIPDHVTEDGKEALRKQFLMKRFKVLLGAFASSVESPEGLLQALERDVNSGDLFRQYLEGLFHETTDIYIVEEVQNELEKCLREIANETPSEATPHGPGFRIEDIAGRFSEVIYPLWFEECYSERESVQELVGGVSRQAPSPPGATQPVSRREELTGRIARIRELLAEHEASLAARGEHAGEIPEDSLGESRTLRRPSQEPHQDPSQKRGLSSRQSAEAAFMHLRNELPRGPRGFEEVLANPELVRIAAHPEVTLVRAISLQEIEKARNIEMENVMGYVLNCLNLMVGTDLRSLVHEGHIYVYSEGYLRSQMRRGKIVGDAEDSAWGVGQTLRGELEDEGYESLRERLQLETLADDYQVTVPSRISRRTPERVRDLAVLTANRPASLERYIDSVKSMLQTYGWTGMRLTIFDTSNVEGELKTNRDLARNNSDANLEIVYLGPQDIRAFLEGVRSELDDERAQQQFTDLFLNRDRLSPDHKDRRLTIGAIRNIIALYFHDVPYISSDDDILMEPRMLDYESFKDMKREASPKVDLLAGTCTDYQFAVKLPKTEFEEMTIGLPSDIVGIADRNLSPELERPYREVLGVSVTDRMDARRFGVVRFGYTGDGGDVSWYLRQYAGSKKQAYLTSDAPLKFALTGAAATGVWQHGDSSGGCFATDNTRYVPFPDMDVYEDGGQYFLSWLLDPDGLEQGRQLEAGGVHHKRFPGGRGRYYERALKAFAAQYVVMGDYLHPQAPESIASGLLFRQEDEALQKLGGELLRVVGDREFRLAERTLANAYKDVLEPIQGSWWTPWREDRPPSRQTMERDLTVLVRGILYRTGVLLTQWDTFQRAAGSRRSAGRHRESDSPLPAGAPFEHATALRVPGESRERVGVAETGKRIVEEQVGDISDIWKKGSKKVSPDEPEGLSGRPAPQVKIAVHHGLPGNPLFFRSETGQHDIQAFGEYDQTENVLRVHVTEEHWRRHLSIEGGRTLLRQMIAHEMAESVLGMSHSDAVDFEKLFTEDPQLLEGHNMSERIKFVLDEAVRRGDIAYLRGLLREYPRGQHPKDPHGKFHDHVAGRLMELEKSLWKADAQVRNKEGEVVRILGVPEKEDDDGGPRETFVILDLWETRWEPIPLRQAIVEWEPIYDPSVAGAVESRPTDVEGLIGRINEITEGVAGSLNRALKAGESIFDERAFEHELDEARDSAGEALGKLQDKLNLEMLAMARDDPGRNSLLEPGGRVDSVVKALVKVIVTFPPSLPAEEDHVLGREMYDPVLIAKDILYYTVYSRFFGDEIDGAINEEWTRYLWEGISGHEKDPTDPEVKERLKKGFPVVIRPLDSLQEIVALQAAAGERELALDVLCPGGTEHSLIAVSAQYEYSARQIFPKGATSYGHTHHYIEEFEASDADKDYARSTEERRSSFILGFTRAGHVKVAYWDTTRDGYIYLTGPDEAGQKEIAGKLRELGLMRRDGGDVSEGPRDGSPPVDREAEASPDENMPGRLLEEMHERFQASGDRMELVLFLAARLRDVSPEGLRGLLKALDEEDQYDKSARSEFELAIRMAIFIEGLMHVYPRDLNVVSQLLPKGLLQNGAEGAIREMQRKLGRDYNGVLGRSVIREVLPGETPEDAYGALINTTFRLLEDEVRTDTGARPKALIKVDRAHLEPFRRAMALFRGGLDPERLEFFDKHVKVINIEPDHRPDLFTQFLMGVKLLDHERERSVAREQGRGVRANPALLRAIAVMAEGLELKGEDGKVTTLTDPEDILREIFNENSVLRMRRIDWNNFAMQISAWEEVARSL